MTQTATHDDMTHRFASFKKQIKDTGSDAITGLEKVAFGLGMNELARQLKLVNDEFRSNTFKLIVVGRFKTGKSSLLNAMLGKPETQVPNGEPQQGPMPVDDLPATAVLTRVLYASPPYVRAWDFKGKATDWFFAKYVREATLRGSEKENQEAFKDIREFEVGYPAPLCKYATLLDSPGTDEAPSRTAITNEAVRHCDAAIVLYSHQAFAGEGERKWVSENILDCGVRVFTVVNLWNGRAVDERLRSLAWNRLVHELLGGEPYRGQDFTSQDIYFVDAKRAGEAKFTGNGSLHQASGMALFERNLTDFLIKERYETHVSRFVRAAQQHSDKVVEQIAQRRAAIVADRQKLEAAAVSIQPKLEDIRARRDKLPKILDRYRRECMRELAVGFEQMIGEVRKQLPSLVKNKPLKSLEGIGNLTSHFSQKAVAAEAAQICMDTIRRRIDEWCKNPPSKQGAQQILEPIIQRMVEEVADEVASIQTSFGNLHFELTGWSPAVPKDAKRDVTGRIIGIVGGILLQDVGLIAGGAGGLRGFGGTLAGYVVGGLLAAFMGLSWPVALPVMLVAGALGGWGAVRAGLETRIWDHTCKKAEEELRNMPTEARTAIENETRNTFAKLEEAIMKDVGSIVEQEEENIRSILRLNQQSQEDKNKALHGLDRAESELAERRKQLKNVSVLVKQVSGQERAALS